ncbi:MAG TPA: SDR family oxidoreductase [Afifellaceae bacterium]|nr:SDR family oxidoreductase [Afifellaceae bacterium]
MPEPQQGESGTPRVAIVTGSARNIGRAIAVALARQGFAIVVHARGDKDGAAETRRLVEAEGASAETVLADLADPGSAAQLVDAARGLGRPAVLVNNAAVRRAVPFAELTLEQWRAVMAVNVEAAFLCAQACLPDMLAAGWGRIVNVGGLSAHRGTLNRVHVATSKAALVGFTKALAVDLAGTGIAVNCVVPGEIETVKSVSASGGHHYPGGDMPVIGRRGRPEEVAAMVAALCGPESGYMIGQTLHVSGGAYMP